MSDLEATVAQAPADRTPSHLDSVYATYRAWKRSYKKVNPAAERELFAREIARLRLPPGAAILEVGFGEARFLDWARDRGFAADGIEILEEYVVAARQRGHRVFQGSIGELPSRFEATYDAVVCFDVLEHLSETEIIELFRSAKRILHRDGAILARFPNGGSPFGRYGQHGDATHRTVLTGRKVDQLAFPAGMRVEGVFNAARVVKSGRCMGLLGRAKVLLAALIELVIGLTYFGQRVPLDPNLVVHLRHRPLPAET